MAHSRRRNPPDPVNRLIIWLILLVTAVPGNLMAVEIGGTDYLDLRKVADRLGMHANWVEKYRIQKLESSWTRLVFEIDRREMELNGHRVHLGYPIAGRHSHLYLSESDFHNQLEPILTPQIFGEPREVRRIIIDPGHGANDPGAENEELGLREKALTLDLAKRLRKLLASQGFSVSLTRDSDVFIPLQKRGEMANQQGVDLFISLHFNASERHDVSGVETYAMTPQFQPSSSRSTLYPSDRKSYPGNAGDPWNTLLGYYVQTRLCKALPTIDRGLKRARFAVLRDLEMPGILIESGFVTDKKEGRNIGSRAYRDKIAQAITEGILAYKQTVDRLRQAHP